MSPYDAVEDAMVSVVKHLSLTGRLLYPIVDKFIVHWPELREQYPRSRLVSSFISHPSEEDVDEDDEDGSKRKRG